ncbi:hypothetical protein COY93_01470 [Candidatus Uhrbacteria bacterium CG_4_10_14_0_8_um_filter_58_22]|uniref:Uncharacterized protein n=1 Tax=Candidatus Uhrbacteria bacterium CG_4_10_14_0_8_um_filter_58_22 TaxID=1975029 RepID=A0A2M7QAG2_9BACT|nr:MAG: hypothetical protein COY93_01470 [Candidatus Uhrbacteria bacterium CG_4_10_14_0_8_um_filter_58_22]
MSKPALSAGFELQVIRESKGIRGRAWNGTSEEPGLRRNAEARYGRGVGEEDSRCPLHAKTGLIGRF